MTSSNENASPQKVKEQSNELRTKYPIFTAILERIPDMDLKEVLSVFVVIDPVGSIEDSRYKNDIIGEEN